MKRLVVDRSKWLTGKLVRQAANEGLTIESKLRDPDIDRMCCLGHYCIQAGIPSPYLNSRGTPLSVLWALDHKSRPIQDIHGVLSQLVKGSESVTEIHSMLAEDMMELNDDQRLTDAQREAKLKEVAQRSGLTIEFVGDYNYEATLAKLKEEDEDVEGSG